MLRSWLTEVRESFTRGGPWVWIEKLLTGFFLVILKLQGGPRSDKIWHIFRPRPQTFCSHARTRENIVILKKNLLSTDGCSTCVPRFKPLRSTRHIIVLYNNRLGHVLFPFARWQYDHAQTALCIRRTRTRTLRIQRTLCRHVTIGTLLLHCWYSLGRPVTIGTAMVLSVFDD